MSTQDEVCTCGTHVLCTLCQLHLSLSAHYYTQCKNSCYMPIYIRISDCDIVLRTISIKKKNCYVLHVLEKQICHIRIVNNPVLEHDTLGADCMYSSTMI